ncbi:MAG: TonB-dependent receptor [Pseudomonadota bacterium]|nr:TonB-dependent receptor [Pseudomonadota bacterium]
MGLRQLILGFLSAFALAFVPSAANAGHDEPRQIDVPAGNLIASINSLARQTGVTIGGAQSGMSQIRTRRVRGRMTAETALRRLLNGTPYTYRRLSGHAFRIVERPRSASRRAPSRATQTQTPRRTAPEVRQTVGPPIIVTASKNDAELQTYPGAATVLDLADVSPARMSGGIEDIAASLPAFATTHLGPGRNKIFIRGFADSSFNGPSQSTTAVYLDEYRLVYSAPNPDLRSTDLRSIEILEGPQGTLYGAGSIGGMLRIGQNSPDADDLSAFASAELTSVEGGGTAGSFAGSFNLPIGDSSALRVVGYRQNLPGYIDDVGRDLENVNSSTVGGWRASFATTAFSDWDVQLDVLQQDLDTQDGQYSQPDIGIYVRSSAVAQPFSSDVSLAGLTISRSWDSVDLVSATNWTESDLETRFDFNSVSAEGLPELFEEQRSVQLLNHETRVNGTVGRFQWLAGISALQNDDRRSQYIGTEADLDEFEVLKVGTREIAGFGEVNFEPIDRVDLTLGLRLVHTRTVTELDLGAQEDIEPKRGQFRALPTFALGYRPREVWYAYGRYQDGFRAGGSTIVVDDINDPDIENFDADEVTFYEIGIRGTFPALSITQFNFSLSYADWENIQSDLIDENGFPFTTNVGNGEIYSVNLSLTAEPWDGFEVETRAFLSRSDTIAIEQGAVGEEGEFPNIPELGITLTARQSLFEREQSNLRIGADYTFVGESVLAPQPNLELDQGNLSMVSAWLDYRLGHNRLTLTIRNLFDESNNRFSFGNPFTVLEQEQATPLQPRTFSIAVSREF